MPSHQSHPDRLQVRTRVLFGGALVYAIYRMIQTTASAAVGRSGGFESWQRLTLSAADGALLAAAVPVALWATRTFPFDRGNRVRSIVAHSLIAFLVAVTWIAAMVGVSTAIGGPAPGPLLPMTSAWLTSNLFAYIVLVAVIQAFGERRRLQERELQAATLRAELAAARLDSLRAQLHPHFLFNTLNTISELIHLDPRAADAMIVRLAQLLRASIDFTGEQEVPLERELEVLRAYVDLQRFRHGERLTVTFDVDPRSTHALVPSFILQPLVENAIVHGIAPRRGAGRVTIGTAVVGDRLELRVRDNGSALAADRREGVGLRNTRSRLHTLYGDRQSLSLVRNEDETEASVSLPFRVR